MHNKALHLTNCKQRLCNIAARSLSQRATYNPQVNATLMPMKFILKISIFLLLVSCATPKNQLIGTWEFDGDKTLSELENAENVPENVLTCYRRKACGYNVILTYTGTTWSQQFSFSQEGSSEKVPYEVVRLTNSEIEIKTKLQGIETEYVTYFINNHAAYTYSEINGFKWKEYLKKKH